MKSDWRPILKSIIRIIIESPRYKGIVLHTTTKKLGKQARKFLKSLPEEEWQNAIRLTFNAKTRQVQAEQGLFAPGDNAYVDEEIFKKRKTEPMTSFLLPLFWVKR